MKHSLSAIIAVTMPTTVFLYVMFFAIKIADHADRNMFQIVTNVLFGN